MKTTPILIALSAVIILSSCDKPVVRNIPQQDIVEPTPAPAPTVTPLQPQVLETPPPAPSPTPEVRLAPEGTLYVIEQFSVTTEDGIHGFPPGKQVTVVREEGEDIIVSDGRIETKESRTKFTNNLDVAEALTHSKRTAMQELHQKSNQAIQSQKQSDAELHRSREKSVLEAQLKRTEEAGRAIAQRIQVLQKEIDDLKSKYGTYSAENGWSFRKAYYSSPTKQRNEMLISQLQRQQSELNSAKKQIQEKLIQYK